MKNIVLNCLLLCCLFPFYLCAKTLIFTPAFNRPDFIELQDALFKKFCEDDYKFIVFNDANTHNMRNKIVQTCRQLGIVCINIPQNIHLIPYLPRQSNFYLPKHNPNVRHCNCIQWAWDHFIVQHKGPVMLIDSDMFPIRPFSLRGLLEGADIGAVFMGTSDEVTGKSYSYLCPILAVFDMEKLPEPHTLCFNCGKLPNTDAVVDSGGYTALYLEHYANQIKLTSFEWIQGHGFYCPYRYTSPDKQQPSCVDRELIVKDLTARGFTENEIQLVLNQPDTIELLCKNHFLHYRAGSNYENDSKEKIDKKTTILGNFFRSLLAEK